MDNSFNLPPLPEPDGWTPCGAHAIVGHYRANQMRAYAREAQTDLIGRLAQMQEHEAIEWLLKARQDWWKS
jgi:hypothetical protein